MRKTPYYSIRTGKNPLAGRIDMPTAKKLFGTLYLGFEEEGYFQEALGYECVDAGFIPGRLGHDLDGVLLLELRKTDMTPIWQKIENYSEEDLFDIIEFLHDHCAKPTERTFHNWNSCGWHCTAFDEAAGRTEYREKVNRVLNIYDKGYELSSDGEILELAASGFDVLLEAPVPQIDPENIEARIDAARRKFRRYRASIDERRDAIRDLADVLEYLRPKVREVLLPKDESDLFNLANNFGIRHHRDNQKTRYDPAIWQSWMFYFYLATIHAVLRMIAKQSLAEKGA